MVVAQAVAVDRDRPVLFPPDPGGEQAVGEVLLAPHLVVGAVGHPRGEEADGDGLVLGPEAEGVPADLVGPPVGRVAGGHGDAVCKREELLGRAVDLE